MFRVKDLRVYAPLPEENGPCRRRRSAAAPPVDRLGPGLERRSILRLGAAAAATAASSIAPLGCGGVKDEATTAVSDPVLSDAAACEASCSAASASLALPFAQYPHLAQVGASVTVSVKGYADPACKRDEIIVAHASAGTYVALSASCTHMCCTVQFRGHDFYCPCHGSTFDLSGRVTGGPAPRPLDSVGVCSDSCGVYVTIG